MDASGKVHVSLAQATADYYAPGARLVYAPFEAGVGFVGEDAASHAEWLAELLACLEAYWKPAADAPAGTIFVDMDDAESGPNWSLTDVATVDDELLASMARATLH